jgi:glycerophosphoryl diester phosphodiesterase
VLFWFFNGKISIRGDFVKKVLALALAFLLILTLTACKKEKKNTDSSVSDVSQVSDTSSVTSQEDKTDVSRENSSSNTSETNSTNSTVSQQTQNNSSQSSTVTSSQTTTTDKNTTTENVEVPKKMKYDIKTIARLGWRPYTGNLPQQSIISYQKAYETGHRILLCDIRLTADGYMVCCHDDDISKVTAYDSKGVKVAAGKVKISETNLNDLLTYDFGKYKNQDGLKILRPQEFAQLCAQYPDVTPCFELKTMTQEKLPELVALIKEYGFENNVMFVSGDAAIRQAIANALPQSVIGVWRYSMNDKLIDQMASLTCAGKFIYVAKEGGEEGKASISYENYIKCKEKGVDIGYTYIASNQKSLFDEIEERGILNYCKYLALDEVSWLYE